MASQNSTTISSSSDPGFHIAMVVMASAGLVSSAVAVLGKLVYRYIIPVSWKCGLLLRDLSSLSVALGLVLVTAYLDGASHATCRAGGFFMLFGVLDLVFNLMLVPLTLLVVQDPCKMSQLSTFRWGLFLSIVLPQKALFILLAMLPVTPMEYFDDEDDPYPLACFPIRQEGSKGATFGAIQVFIVWVLVAMATVLCVVNAVRFHRGPSTRIHASSPSIWQIQKVEQGKSLHKFSFFDVIVAIVLLFLVVVVVYTNSSDRHAPQWIALTAMAAVCLLRSVVGVVQFVLWSRLCCNETAQKNEPHHRLKQLQLIRNEGPGRLRMKANWTARKGMWRQGLLKVYGPEHIKAWAQEIVVLGLLRKSHSASVLQCLWTSNSNPYYETMTLISGEIVTGDSRLTCLELTSSGTLQDLLRKLEVPLPEPCQKTILHDIAEGLSYLHDQNVLHRNLTSAAVYLKGSVQCLVLRAAVGDFEDAQIYGTALTGSPNSTICRKRFFYPDIRAYALVGIEMLSRTCECRKRERQPHRRTLAKIEKPKNEALTPSKYGHLPGPGLNYSRSSDMNMYAQKGEVNDMTHSYELKRFEKQELPYCAPGEVEYIPSVKENAVKRRESPSKAAPRVSPVSGDIGLLARQSGDAREIASNSNWQLQLNPASHLGNSVMGGDSSSSCDEYTALNDRFKHNMVPGVTNVKEFKNFEFPNDSIFKAVDENMEEDLDMIEENIQRNQKFPTSRNYKHGGYVTSKTEDGREVFIPAVYKSKNSGGNSSSGYGSCGGSASIASEYFPSGMSSVVDESSASIPENKKVHKTVSAATVSSFGDDILEVLPALADETPRTGEELLKELMKAKQDAKVEQLIESFKERFRRGELGALPDGLPDGIIFPKKDRQGTTGQIPNPSPLPSHIERDLDTSHTKNNVCKVKPVTTKIASPRPKTATESMKQHLSRGNNTRPSSAASSSVFGWNARNSIKRTKAREALKKSLVNKGNPFQLKNVNEIRGNRGKEVEMKYANRKGSGTPGHQIHSNNSNNNNINNNDGNQITTTKDSVTRPAVSGLDSIPKDKSSTKQSPSLAIKTHQMNGHSSEPRSKQVARRPSTKTKPAPPPPYPPPCHTHSQTQIIISGSTPRLDNTSNDVVTIVCESSFTKDDESVTSLEPQSVSSMAASFARETDTQAESVMDITEKIQTDMNKIIHGEATNDGNNLQLPPGIRLIDSGFDSESISSEESCLCAASALTVGEDGSCSCPSENLSQGACSCACSNCLKEFRRHSKDSSWNDSIDSESWSNSNSLSSYDTNMHRRKLPSTKTKTESSGGALAPDEQYPSPVHRTKRRGANSLLYSPKRNHRNLGHMRGNGLSSASDTSSAASRRYRELIKKGVPLRVSVVSGDADGLNLASHVDVSRQVEIHPIPEHIKEESNENDELYSALDDSNVADMAPEPGHYEPGFYHEQEYSEDNYCQISTMPTLDEIIKEIPDETGQFPDETRAFLNRPESELSLKALQAVLAGHGSTSDERRIQDAERTIDRLFSNQYPPMHSINGALELDESAIKEIAMLPNIDSEDFISSDTDGLLVGMDGRHVRYCHTISSRIHLVNFNELLPANAHAFDQLKDKLQLHGGFGVIGSQLISLIQSCWLNEAPPSTSSLLEHLKDSVTETEL